MKPSLLTPFYQAPTITLIRAIKDAKAQSITQLTLNILSHQQHKAIIDLHEDDTETIYRELVKLGTGLSESELKQLVLPDYNTLLDLVDEHYGQTSLYWFEKAKQPMSSEIDKLTLLQPLKCFEGEFNELSLTFPTLDMLDMMKKCATDQQDAFMKMSITGLSTESLQQLCIADWRMLDQRVTDFLSQTGDFFSVKKIENSSSITSS